MMARYRKFVQYFWLSLIVALLVTYLIRPELFSLERIGQWIQEQDQFAKTIYIVIVLIRSAFFIPSTYPLLLGLLLFPNELVFLLIVNMLGIMGGASLLYFAARFFTPEDFFSEKRLKSLPKIKEKINKHGFTIVLLWSFFPLVPTDLICFVAGATNMKYLKFATAVFIGEVVLVSVYLYTGKELMDFVF